METLFAFIEFTQFQRYVKDKMDDETKDEIKEVELIRFPVSIPMSSILEEKQSDDEVHDLKIKAHHVYRKYVMVGGELEINISWECRKSVIEILDDLELLISTDAVTLKDLFNIFNDCKFEMWNLMLGSFSRYKSKLKFDELELPDSVNKFDVPQTGIEMSA